MSDRISSRKGAAIIGRKDESLRRWFAGPLGHVGERQGRERQLAFKDVALLAVVEALVAGNHELDGAVAAAEGLLPEIGRIGTNPEAQNEPVFAVLASRMENGQRVTKRLVAEGVSGLTDFVEVTAQVPGCDLRIINLTDLTQRMFIGWAMATSTADEVRRFYRDSMHQLDASRRAQVMQTVDEMERRLFGRRNDPSEWGAWGPSDTAYLTGSGALAVDADPAVEPALSAEPMPAAGEREKRR